MSFTARRTSTSDAPDANDGNLDFRREQLSKAVGPAPGARLCLCPADEAAYRGANLGGPWPTEIDPTLEPGHCRLACEDGEWVLDFDALIAALAPDSSTRATSGKPINRS